MHHRNLKMAAPLVGRQAPDFTCEAVMPDGSFKTISLRDFADHKYVMLLFYPLDFTFVCPSEILAFSEQIAAFEERNVQVLACSIDSKFTHLAWRNTPRDKGGLGKVNYPMLSDINKEVARSYGVLLPDGMALRGLVLIDKKGVVQHQLVNALGLGRDVSEALRIVDALQHHEEFGEVCPANWKKGSGGMVPSPQGVSKYLAEQFSK